MCDEKYYLGVVCKQEYHVNRKGKFQNSNIIHARRLKALYKLRKLLVTSN